MLITSSGSYGGLGVKVWPLDPTMPKDTEVQHSAAAPHVFVDRWDFAQPEHKLYSSVVCNLQCTAIQSMVPIPPAAAASGKLVRNQVCSCHCHRPTDLGWLLRWGPAVCVYQALWVTLVQFQGWEPLLWLGLHRNLSKICIKM